MNRLDVTDRHILKLLQFDTRLTNKEMADKPGVRNMQECKEFIINKLSRLANIYTLQSSFVMTELINETAFHLD
jgi:DNA-binding Lrp family transcriptional regulator